MHPFCCVSERNPVTSSSSLTEFLTMPLHQPAAGAGAGSSPQSISGLNNSSHSIGDHGRLNRRTVVPAMESLSRLPAMNESQIVGNRISGYLYKWVNYGKGWRPRWFVVQDGVLSYYKIHGPQKIIVNQETEKGSKVIGEESLRQIRRHKNSKSQLPRKTLGEVHLKISSIRDSKSDDKRFSIFTGTKRLHLRAETREDRATWMEALQAVKDMFPRMSNGELMAPVDNVVVSTEKLRQRLLEEGVNEAAIQDSEQIMRSELSVLQNQLVLLKQRQSILIDTLRQLEVYIKIRRKHLANGIADSSTRSFTQSHAFRTSQITSL
ncbi:hypothetical protein HHK36_030400 [Tetracentron sinense]|uniref:PH domain-containing protein n=1 Tax=Tetracentron sinense TaxID=13715 RepID=A0A834Y9C6_TETSI|nr:hypothetical protein HHK36_030400 [Tetracentron sinense]